MGKALVVAALIAAGWMGAGAQTPLVQPFESEATSDWTNPIDVYIRSALREQGIEQAAECSDEVFVRRVYLDVIGTLPTAQEIVLFLRDPDPAKRTALIESLFGRDEFADYWAMKWCDLLRVKAEFPINLWPNAVQAYHRWIHDAIRQNMPYDQFARELLTSSGSNFRVPQVNFYRAVQGREPSAIAGAVALTFMGSRIESWPEPQRINLEAFFTRIAYKSTGEWKEEIVYLDPEPAGSLDAVLPDGTALQIPPDADPREMFASWLVMKDNPYFARAVVNRVWSWLLGRGLIHEPDDIRPDNPPVYPEVLAYLESELIRTNFDLRHIYRLVLNSATYQQSSIPHGDYADAESKFACYPVRQLDAEVVIDSLNAIFGGTETYSSPIPEPFTYVPEHVRAVEIADGSITSSFLEMFGRPARDTGVESERDHTSTDAQRLHMLNSGQIQRKIQRSDPLRRIFAMANKKPAEGIRQLYLTILSRRPTEAEVAEVMAYAQTEGMNPRDAIVDVAWALVNTKEFLCRH